MDSSLEEKRLYRSDSHTEVQRVSVQNLLLLRRVKKLEKVNPKIRSSDLRFRRELKDIADTSFQPGHVYTVIVLGASGDLAKKKLFPALCSLWRKKLLPNSVLVVGFARTKMTTEEFRNRIRNSLEPSCAKEMEDFLSRTEYFSGNYDDEKSFFELNEFCEKLENERILEPEQVNRVFYLAVPPNLFVNTSRAFQPVCFSDKGWNRVIVEKPFGRDSESSAELQKSLLDLFLEDQIYRIDHYLGKEMVMNLMTLRFANYVFEPLWNRQNIAHVQITFKEDIGVEGRAGYFDNYGIIRDIMQNHLMQIFCLLAMESPASKAAEDIRDEKVKVLRCVPELTLGNVVVGQYEGYREEEGVPKDSITPTFAVAQLSIKNSRWHGVPFILKCGKGLNQRKAEIRIQYQQSPSFLFPDSTRNELVIRIQPREAMWIKLLAKVPGDQGRLVETELDLTYHQRFKGKLLPDAYEHLLRDVVLGDHSQFVRSDELGAAWAIFSPLLKELEEKRIEPLVYKRGSRGPAEADEFLLNSGYVHSESYQWPGGSEK